VGSSLNNSLELSLLFMGFADAFFGYTYKNPSGGDWLNTTAFKNRKNRR